MKKNEWANYIHINCRTCAHSTPKEDSTWRCERYDATIEIETQHGGKDCPAHTLHPDLVPWAMKDSDHEWTATFEIDGTNVQNGENGFSSQELINNALGCANPVVEKVKKIWPSAKVVK